MRHAVGMQHNPRPHTSVHRMQQLIVSAIQGCVQQRASKEAWFGGLNTSAAEQPASTAGWPPQACSRKRTPAACTPVHPATPATHPLRQVQ